MESLSVKNNLLTKRWMVIYTRPRWEKKVDQLLTTAKIQSYCPLKREVHEWADRKKIVDVPLFDSYVFVKINMREEAIVRQTLGVINFIYFQGRPAIVRDNVIEEIQRFLDIYPNLEVMSMKELSVGDRVRIKEGAFMNQTGDILQVQGKNVLMALEHLGCILLAKVSSNNIVLEKSTQNQL